MRTSFKLVVAAFAATLLLSAAVGGASARNLSINNQGLRITFSSIEMNAEEFAVIRCQATLEGSFHTRTVAKVAGTLVGAITSARVKQETCREGIAAAFNGTERYNGGTPSNTLPWHLTYEGFSGTLPNITSMQALISRFRLGTRDNAALCTGQYGTATDNITVSASRGEGGAITSVAPVEGRNSITMFRRDAGLFCPLAGRMAGRGEVMLLGATNRLTITLI